MPTRREFLESATVTLLMVPLVRCGSSTSSVTPVLDAGLLPDGNACNGIAETSTVVAGHSHMVCVLASDLAVPPAGGVTFTTTTANGHAHTVTLSQSQLQAIQSGQTIVVTTGITNSHTHSFTIQRM